jgi:Protein of unknown function (DUF1579)
MRHLQLTLAGLSVVLVASVAVAKEKKAEKPMDPQAMMEVYAKLATPGEPHKQFASLVGSWTTKTKEWVEPNKPLIESTGSAEMKMLLDGRFLQQEFTGDMMGRGWDHRIRQPSQAICLDLDRYHEHRDLHDGRHGERGWQNHHPEGAAS